MSAYPRLTILCLAACLVVTAIPTAQAQNPSKQSFTWPLVITSVTTINGWVVAEGRTADQTNKIIWRSPLAPAAGSVAVRNGWGTMFIEIGNRQFIVDDATGQTRELRPGQVVRQDLPWGPGGVPGPRSPGGPVAPTTQSSVALSAQAQEMLDAINKANTRLIEALATLEVTARDYDQKKASMEDYQKAREGVRNARLALEQANKGMLSAVPPELTKPAPTPTAVPAVVVAPRPAKVDPKVADAQKKLMDVTASYVEAQMTLNNLLKKESGNTAAINTATDKVRLLASDLDRQDAQLRELRLVEDVEPCPINVKPGDMARIARVEKNILQLNDRYRIVQDQMQQVQQAYANKTVDDKQLAEAQAAVVDVMQKITAARRELEDLRRSTCQAAMEELTNNEKQ
jgi:hypothetical protein